MRKVLYGLLGLLILLLPKTMFAGPLFLTPEQEELLDIQDEYDTTELVNVGVTSAEVNTEETKVMLPMNPCAVSFRPGTGHVAVKGTDSIKVYAPGTGMVEQLTLSCPGVISVSYSKDGGHLYACTENSVLKYAVSSEGYILVSQIGSADLVAVEGGKGHEIWVLKKTALERWLGTPDGGYSVVSVAALAKGKSVSYSPTKNSVVVLDDSTLRYFAVAHTAEEIQAYRTTVAGATAAVQTESAVRVLTAGGSRYFSVQPSGLVEVAALNDPGTGFALAVPSDKSQDFALLKRGAGGSGDLGYRALSQEGYVENPGRTASNVADSVGYKREAVLISSTFSASIPVNKIKAVLDKSISSNTGVRLDISTDGGITWITDVTLDEVCEVSEGSALVYRLVLETRDPMDTPAVDSIELLQILTTPVVPGMGGIAGGGSQVRLVP